MTLDKRVISAIEEAVAEAGEQPPLAEKVVAWLDALASGNARLSDRDSTDRHIDLLYQQVSGSAEDV